MSIQADIQQLAGDTIIILYALDASALGGITYYFHADTSPIKANVVWNGVTYSAMPIEANGFEFAGAGKIPRPSLRTQNVDGIVGALADTYDDLIGAKITRKRTLLKYLDAVNFSGGINPTADPSAAFPDDVYYIIRKASHTKHVIEFELASSMDVHGVRLPRRPIVGSLCPTAYRSAECGYAGGPVATALDVPTGDSSQDTCGKRVASCKLRFGENGVLPYGGFTGAGRVR